jgi:hypothetical protein
VSRAVRVEVHDAPPAGVEKLVAITRHARGVEERERRRRRILLDGGVLGR